MQVGKYTVQVSDKALPQGKIVFDPEDEQIQISIQRGGRMQGLARAAFANIQDEVT